MMKVTFIEHSGFLVETDSCAVIFDYYTGDIPLLPAEIPLYVLASHNHHDHFNPEIFKLQERYPRITYLLSSDVKTNHQGEHIHWAAPDQTVEFPHFELRTTGSTDQGVSFLLRMKSGQTLFHAGDLNWWTWVGEETEAQAHTMEERFKMEVAKLALYPIDLAFLPLDPRQQERCDWGFDYFMRTLNISLAFPMHFWKKDSVIDQLKESDKSAAYRERIGALRKSGDSMSL